MATHPAKREIPLSRASKTKKNTQRQLHMTRMAPNAGSPGQAIPSEVTSVEPARVLMLT